MGKISLSLKYLAYSVLFVVTWCFFLFFFFFLICNDQETDVAGSFWAGGIKLTGSDETEENDVLWLRGGFQVIKHVLLCI